MPSRQTSSEQSVTTRSHADDVQHEDKKRTAKDAGLKNDTVPDKRSKSEDRETSTTRTGRQGHQPHESIKEILEDEDYELVSERTNKYGNSTLIFMDKNTGLHATYPNVSQEFYEPGSREISKDESSTRSSYSRQDDGVQHGHVQGAVLHPDTDKRLKENQDGTPYQAEAGKHSHQNTPTKADRADTSSDSQTNHGQGAVLHPETDKRLKENRDKETSETDRKDDVQHGHVKGAVLHPETDRRLKENRDKEPSETESKDDVQHGHVKGAVLHPETDRRLKENRDKPKREYSETERTEAKKQSTSNGTSYDKKHNSYDSISNDDSYELVEEHENKSGAYTMVYRNKDTDYHIVFPNVKKDGPSEESKRHKESNTKRASSDSETNHGQGAVNHPETDKRLKENRDKETSETKTSETKDSSDSQKNKGQGAVNHPESDKRLKENQDGETYQSEAGKGKKTTSK